MNPLTLVVLLLLLAVPAAQAAPDSDDVARLPAEVLRVIRALDVAPGEVSIWVQALDVEAALLSFNVDKPRNPASTMKLVTSFAALEALNPAYRWETEILATGTLRGGVLDGDLIVKGGGDPYLVVEEYWRLWSELRREGVERIRGDLLFDVSYFDLPDEDPGAFDGRPDRVYNLAPHPLLVNFNAVRFDFEPARNGRDVSVTPYPRLPNLQIDNRLGQQSARCGGYQRGVALHVLEQQRDRVVLEGEMPSGCRGHRMTRTVLQPETYAYELFSVLWTQLGGVHEGGWGYAEVPDDAVHLMTHRSRPLGDVIRLINKYSNNVMTRHLKLTLGAELFGAPATIDKGNRAIREVLEARDVSLDGLVLDNASGLSREARLTARTLAGLLRAARRSPYMPEFVSSLSLAGLDGTVRTRFARAPQAGRMHLKTGRLNEVAAIAGYVKAASGTDYLVVVMVNSPQAHRGPGEEIQNAVLDWTFRQ